MVTCNAGIPGQHHDEYGRIWRKRGIQLINDPRVASWEYEDGRTALVHDLIEGPRGNLKKLESCLSVVPENQQLAVVKHLVQIIDCNLERITTSNLTLQEEFHVMLSFTALWFFYEEWGESFLGRVGKA